MLADGWTAWFDVSALFQEHKRKFDAQNISEAAWHKRLTERVESAGYRVWINVQPHWFRPSTVILRLLASDPGEQPVSISGLPSVKESLGVRKPTRH